MPFAHAAGTLTAPRSRRGLTARRWLGDDQFVALAAETLLLVRPGTVDPADPAAECPHDGTLPSGNLAAPGAIDRVGRYLAVIDSGAEPEFATADDLGVLTRFLDTWYAGDAGGDVGWVESIELRDLDTDRPVPYEAPRLPSAPLQRVRTSTQPG